MFNKKNFFIGLNFILNLWVKEREIKIKIDKPKANTPPSLLGIERKIAYANKKYHSGWICGGVIIGLAIIKLSGSYNI